MVSTLQTLARGRSISSFVKLPSEAEMILHKSNPCRSSNDALADKPLADKPSVRSHEPRTAWLLPDMGTGGLSFQHIISEFAKQFPNTVVYTGQWPGYAVGFEDDFSVKEVGATRYVELNQSKGGYAIGFSYASPRIIQELLKFQPDIIFANAFSVWTFLAIACKIIGRWKVVVTYEGGSPTYENPRNRVRHFTRQLIARWADAFVANSRAGKDYLQHTLGIRSDRIFSRPFLVSSKKALLQESAESAASAQSITPSITPSEFVRVEAARAEAARVEAMQREAEEFRAQLQNRPLFLYVGQIIPRKGVRILLEACKALNREGHGDFGLMIVGDGEQRSELETYCLEEGLADRVKWLGKAPYHRLGEFFKIADIFVLPTFDDIWGMVLTEAMLFGMPVICSNKAGAVEMVEASRNGFSYNPLSVEQLVHYMRQFLERPELTKQMGEQSALRIARHSPERAVQAFIEAANLHDHSTTIGQEVTCVSSS